MGKVDTTIRVRYKETDRMGIVHHSNYYVYFEIGRTEFMRGMGFSYREMEEMGYMMPVVETHCHYKMPAKDDDELIISTMMTKFKGARVVLEYEIRKKVDGALLAHGSTVQAITDSNLKPINIKKECPMIYEKFMECI
ncbi:MAG: acyl-CoA thioesterase [Clostridiales bacterium]|nr:acyl-CoA thioesterase [Clostridiales bacterium]